MSVVNLHTKHNFSSNFTYWDNYLQSLPFDPYWTQMISVCIKHQWSSEQCTSTLKIQFKYIHSGDIVLTELCFSLQLFPQTFDQHLTNSPLTKCTNSYTKSEINLPYLRYWGQKQCYHKHTPHTHFTPTTTHHTSLVAKANNYHQNQIHSHVNYSQISNSCCYLHFPTSNWY